MITANDGGFRNIFVIHSRILDLNRADPFASGLNHILGSVGYFQEAVRTDAGNITRIEPAVLINGASLVTRHIGEPVVAFGHPGASDFQCAGRFPIPGKFPAAVIKNAHLNSEYSTTLQKLHFCQLLFAVILHTFLQAENCAERTRFSHSPALHDSAVMLTSKAFDNDPGACCATHAYSVEARDFQIVAFQIIQ